MRPAPNLVAAVVVSAGLVTACGGDDDAAGLDASRTAEADGPAGGAGRPSVVVTTNILGHVVSEVLGDQADIEVLMPPGADPHEFSPSARQAEAMEEAELLVVNGAGFEAGMVDLVEAAEAEGTPVFAFSDHIELLELDGSDDPHLWTDPSRMIGAVGALAERAGELDGVDPAAIETQADRYAGRLEALDTEIADLLADLPDDRRVLVTDHEVFGYFADRYGFEVIGAVIPSTTTDAAASAADIEALAALIRERQVPAIFGETTQPTELAQAVADEAGSEVEVVELFTESLGGPGSGAETYIDMMRLNAERIGTALT